MPPKCCCTEKSTSPGAVPFCFPLSPCSFLLAPVAPCHRCSNINTSPCYPYSRFELCMCVMCALHPLTAPGLPDSPLVLVAKGP